MELKTACSLITAACALVLAGYVTAGPLNPPAGPVTSTYKTLGEIEPRTPIGPATTPGDADSLYRITQPGSYYLTGNIAGVAGKHGIEIAAPDVTIDLGGHAIVGVAGTLTGIRADNSVGNIAIRHGAVRSCAAGVTLGGPGGRLADLLVADNTDDGAVLGQGATVAGCTALANGDDGFSLGVSSTVEGCVANGNGASGIRISASGVISGCSVRDNGGDGISAGNGAVVVGCSARDNGGFGITTSSTANVRGCAAYFSGAAGIEVGSNSTIADCTVSSSGAEGITTTNATTISGCTVTASAGTGIKVGTDCAVLHNTCDNNGSGAAVDASIRATGADNRIEGNTVTDSEIGIEAAAAGNLIIRNSATGNADNYSIAAGNTTGPIVTSATIATSNNPHANYEF